MRLSKIGNSQFYTTLDNTGTYGIVTKSDLEKMRLAVNEAEWKRDNDSRIKKLKALKYTGLAVAILGGTLSLGTGIYASTLPEDELVSYDATACFAGIMGMVSGASMFVGASLKEGIDYVAFLEEQKPIKKNKDEEKQ